MKRWLAWVLILSIGALFTGCQKTPEQPIVIGKENDGWEEAAASEDEKTQLGAPERYQAEYQWKDLTVRMDAQVDAPEEQVYPVYVLERAVFSQELVDRMMDALVGDRPLYRVENGRTKETIQQEIDYYTNELRTEGQTEEHLQHFQEILAELIAEKEQAPESPVKMEASRTLGYVDSQDLSEKYGYAMETKDGGICYLITDEGRRKAEADGNVGICGQFVDDRGTEKVFLLENRPKGSSRVFFGIPDGAPMNFGGEEYSQQEAEEVGRAFLDHLGIDYEILVCQELERDNCYQMTCRTTFPELKQLKSVAIEPAPLTRETTQFSPPIVQESIDIFIDGNGIYGLEWYAPQQLVKKEQENTVLLPWEKIVGIMEKNLEVRNLWEEESEVISRRLEINRIVLSYMNVRKESDFSATYYIPVWDVIGTMVYCYEENYAPEYDGWILDENQERIAYENCSVLTVNAIDGSVIERQ